MRIVLDTNILLQSIAHKSRMRPIWDAYLNEYFSLVVSNAILFEYEEKIAEKTSKFVALNVVLLICEAVNSVLIDVWYEWNSITSDIDDNKFFDTAIAGNADYIVTNDAHFNEAKMLAFPAVNIINGDAFLKLLASKE